MLQLDYILNEIDEEWDVPISISHHYDMALFNEEEASICVTEYNHRLAVFFAE